MFLGRFKRGINVFTLLEVVRSMMNKHNAVLVVEDCFSIAEMYKDFLESEGIPCFIVDCGQHALNYIEQNSPPVVLLDLTLPDMSGMEVLKRVNPTENNIDFIVITGHNCVDASVETFKLGATDYLVKPVDAKRLIVTVKNVLKLHNLSSTVCEMKNCYEMDSFFGFIGSSPEMQNVYLIIRNAADSKASVFITGESGTGKEVCANAIHQQSNRSNGPFIAINCGAIPKDLIESEIFGHVKGAFTGALAHRKGAAESADGGTLFLDEICEMNLDLQVKLLRFIQTGTFQKIGSSETQKVDVRFICATNRDPFAEVKNKNFREDLFYRLHVIPITLPPLRNRGKDCLLIAEKLLKEYAEEESKDFEYFEDDVKRQISNYSWPGNVRELQNVIRQIVVLNNASSVSLKFLPMEIQIADGSHADLSVSKNVTDVASDGYADQVIVLEGHNGHGNNVNGSFSNFENKNYSEALAQNNHSPQPPNAQNSNVIPYYVQSIKDVLPLWCEEKRVIENTIHLCGGSIPKAASLLQVSASTIYRKKQQWESMDDSEKSSMQYPSNGL